MFVFAPDSFGWYDSCPGTGVSSVEALQWPPTWPTVRFGCSSVDVMRQKGQAWYDIPGAHDG